ncbi:MAG: prolipoprotein diacylglyceryl transferase family protein, partial [Dehalococcoidia bacterium]
MNGIVINIDPVAFHIGSFELRWYSVAVLAAIIVAVLIGAREAKKKGIPSDEIFSLALWAIVGGIAGARLFHVIDHFGYYTGNPSQILHFQGLAIWGALAGGGLAAVVYARLRHLPLGR